MGASTQSVMAAVPGPSQSWEVGGNDVCGFEVRSNIAKVLVPIGALTPSAKQSVVTASTTRGAVRADRVRGGDRGARPVCLPQRSRRLERDRKAGLRRQRHASDRISSEHGSMGIDFAYEFTLLVRICRGKTSIHGTIP
jgi:hypothetical protein